MKAIKLTDLPLSLQAQARQQLMGFMPDLPVQEVAQPPSREPKLNKTETEYQNILLARERAGEITAIRAQSIKIQIGEKRCWYTPDFTCVNKATGRIQFHEVKGGKVWDDARVKFQAAKLNYPEFDWIWAQKKEGVWTLS